MTAFCGYLDRQEARDDIVRQRILNDARDRARRSLSRDPNHKLHEYVDTCMFLIAFDNGAWGRGGVIPIESGGIAWVSGDPLIPGGDGISNDPSESALQVATALASRNGISLSCSAGSFSAVFWSPIEKKLRLCADKLALRPLYVYSDGDSCYFASSIRVLRAIVPRELELDDSGMAQFVYLAQNLGSKTIFRNVEVVTPGTILEISAKIIDHIQYYCWNQISPHKLDFVNSSQELYQSFIAATRRRLRGRTSAEAFLTGGMDSRSVVAALLDCGLKVRAFNYSYKNSADDILGRMLAEWLNIEYISYHSNPMDRLKINADYFAINAKSNFPRRIDEGENAGRLIWSGDGGSVGLGHVYMTNENVALAQRKINETVLMKLFPGFNQSPSRLIDRSLARKLRHLGMSSMEEHWGGINPTQPSRKIFMYYLLNDQMRHLYHHFEQIDLSNIEFEMPFFDMDFLSLVVSLPIDLFLGHKLYNHWISEFTTQVDQIPWQAYPDHEPCPLSSPSNILSQWGTDWYGGKVGADVAKTVINTLLKDQHSATWKYLDRRWLYALLMANAVGIRGYNYETGFARRIYEEVSGELVFSLPS